MAQKHSRRKEYVLAAALAIVACCVSAVLLLSSSTSTKESLVFYSDSALTARVDESKVFSWPDASPGWLNRTLWVKNAGSKPFYLALYIVLPEGWRLLWDYDNSLIGSGQNRSITFSAYVPEPTDSERVLSRVRIYCIFPQENIQQT